uniref:Uncharacterized protein n=1 Tax=Mimivirus LCMiAC01 TaxID=2506608 RepID=A0A481Z010_9VIRU|nr:MAG: hypothetical protein LCMiAC01_01020 [Mimivirus LCMiAC01]
MSKSDSIASLVNGTFGTLIEQKINKNIESIYKKITPDHEFEMMFFNYKGEINRMGLETHMNIVKYINYRSKTLQGPTTGKNKVLKEKIVRANTLDVIYQKKNTLENFRVSINGTSNINKYMEMFHLRNNHVIFNVLVKLVKKKKEIKIIKKIKKIKNIKNINELEVKERKKKK